jgi:Integrase zinc binding domain
MQYCTEFFISDDKLWWKDPQGQHKIVVAKERRCFLLSLAHNDVRHHGFYAINALLSERYWWPHMSQDITWFVLTCHICQVWKTQKILIPPVVTMPVIGIKNDIPWIIKFFIYYISNQNPILLTTGAVRIKSADYTC